jgi:CSLREA domain-containing protein
MPPRSLTRQVRLVLLSASLAVVVTLGGINTLQAADITVNTFDDELNTDGDCSLREAIEAANQDAAVDACPKGDGHDRVLLGSGLWLLGATLEFTATLASAGPALSLVGAGADRTVLSGNGQTRLIHVAQGAAVEIGGLTLAEGHAPNGLDYGDYTEELEPSVLNGEHGGAILNEGILLVSQSTIRDSSAGNGGSIFDVIPEIREAGSAGKGGGIYNAGVLTISQSAILSNTAGVSGRFVEYTHSVEPSGGDGGGIFNAGILYVQNSTISHNSTPDGGDGVSTEYYPAVHIAEPGHGGPGGGLFNGGVATLDNVTLVENWAGRGGIVIAWISESESITRYGSSGFGGGLRTIGENVALTLTNTILAYNQGSGEDCAGVIRSRGFNLIQDATACTITDASAHDQIGVDPLLFPLGMYGGATPVHRPIYLSPVLDRGSCLDSHGNTVTVDQHGTARPFTGACDIGAYEAAELPELTYLPVIGRQ